MSCNQVLLVVVLVLAGAELSVCVQPCSLTELHNDSTLLGLDVNWETDLTRGKSKCQKNIILTIDTLFMMIFFAVIVHSTVCPNLDTVGPSWYRLDVLGSAKHDGYFKKTISRSSTVVKENVREICKICKNMVHFCILCRELNLWLMQNLWPFMICPGPLHG